MNVRYLLLYIAALVLVFFSVKFGAHKLGYWEMSLFVAGILIGEPLSNFFRSLTKKVLKKD